MEIGQSGALAGCISYCADLQRRHPRYSATDADGVRARIFEMSDGRCNFWAPGGGQSIGFEGASARLAGIWIKYLSWTGAVQCQTATLRSPEHHVALHIALKGRFDVRQGERMRMVAPGEMVVVNEPGLIEKRWSGDHAVLNLMIDRDALNGVMFDHAPPGMLTPDPLTVVDLAGTRSFLGFIETVVSDAARSGLMFSVPSASQSAEQLLIQLFYNSMWFGKPQNGRSTSGAAPYYVRRAEQFMRENIGRQITIEDLAVAADVAPRTVYQGFSDFRGRGPMKVLKSMRLRQARTALQSAPAGSIRIADVAASVGYGSGARFAHDYRAMFGETARDTLQRFRASAASSPLPRIETPQ